MRLQTSLRGFDMCSLDDEIQALRKSNKELLNRLKLLAESVSKMTPEDGIARLISETYQSVEMIKKYDSNFKLSWESKNDIN